MGKNEKDLTRGCHEAHGGHMPDEIRIHVRIAEELKKRVQSLSEITGLDEATLVRKSLESIAEYFEEHGELTVPFALLPKSAVAPRQSKKSGKTAALPAQKSGRADAPIVLTPNPSTDSTRLSLNEDAAEPPSKKRGPRLRPTRAAIHEIAVKGTKT
jgi:hypothetical protein